MKKRRIVVTGIGVVNPCGVGKNVFWENITRGVYGIKQITRFDSSDSPIKVAGEIKEFNVEEYVPKRMMVKCDRFTHYALAATGMALEDSELEISEDNEYRCGIFYGNNSGGWDICERGFYEMYNDGCTMVNPWQATAWFQAAPQGYTAIRYGIKGLSKTFVADRVSGSSAIYFSILSILTEQNDITITGGTEAPITPFGVICYHESGEMSNSLDPITACKPFDKDSSGIVLGEGSTVLILEELDHAIGRGAHIYGEITGWAMGVGESQDIESMEKCMKSAILKSRLSLEDIDLLVPEGNGAEISDYVERTAINNLWKYIPKKLPVTLPKSLCGHLYGASTSTDVACGLLAINSGLLPECKNSYEVKQDHFEIVNNINKPKTINNVLVNSRSREGVNVSFVLSRYN